MNVTSNKPVNKERERNMSLQELKEEKNQNQWMASLTPEILSKKMQNTRNQIDSYILITKLSKNLMTTRDAW